jgi:hypothetical protein
MGRWSTVRLIEALDPETDYWRIYRLHAQQEFPWDVARALELALYRTYAVPDIGGLLDRTGEFRTRTRSATTTARCCSGRCSSTAWTPSAADVPCGSSTGARAVPDRPG